MDMDEARDLLSRALKDQREARAAQADAEATVESSRLIIQGVLRRYPALAEDARAEAAAEGWDSGEVAPRGAEAVLRVLQVNENKTYSVPDMVQALNDRGWLPDSDDPANAVRTAMERLRTANTPGVKKFRKEGTVLYRFNEPEPSTEGAAGK
jgi:hypothetical protein